MSISMSNDEVLCFSVKSAPETDRSYEDGWNDSGCSYEDEDWNSSTC